VVQIHSPRPIFSRSYLGLLGPVYIAVDKIVAAESGLRPILQARNGAQSEYPQFGIGS